VTVVLGGVEVCRTTRAWRVLETSHPPGWYLPRADWLPDALEPADGASFCEFKGVASYLDVVGGGVRAARAAWTYEEPTAAFAALAGAVAVYPAAVDACFVDGERVRPQEGGFYGGWITDDVVGPFKGAPGTLGW
jgi:uncharacterized protein (DUF427 family)